MSAPDESGYTLKKLLSQNEMCQSWLAVDNQAGTDCFVKTINPDSSVDKAVAASILQNSYSLQRRLRNSRIITAVRKQLSGGSLYVEYRYLDRDVWQQLTEDFFWRFPRSILIQMFLLVDLLHLREVVHCDLKLGNFLVKTVGDEPELILVDLDFLVEAGASPKGRVFGTPNHIAPEILANDTIVAQSDNYSLGVALKNCLGYLDNLGGDAGQCASSVVERLSRLTDRLTMEDPLLRPYNLLDALLKAELVDETTAREASKKLFSYQMMGDLGRTRTIKAEDGKSLWKVICEDNRVLGIHDEFVRELSEIWGQSRLKALELFKTMVARGDLERYGDYWRLDFSEEAVKDILDEFDDALGRPDSVTRYGGLEGHALAEEAKRAVAGFKEKGDYMKALIDLTSVWKRLQSDASVSADDRRGIVRESAFLAVGLGRLKDAVELFQQLDGITEHRSQPDLEARYEQVGAMLNLGETTESTAVIAMAINEAKSVKNAYYELQFLRMEAWRLGLQGDNEKAEALLESVLQRAGVEQLHEVEVTAHYTAGVISWRREQFGLAKERLLKGYDIARKHGLLSKSIGTILGLSMLNCEMALYGAAVKYGKLAIRHIKEMVDRSSVANLAVTLSPTYSRLGEHKKAQYWLLKMIAPELCVPSRDRMVSFYVTEGFIRINRGECGSASQPLAKAQDIIGSSTRSRLAAKVYHNLAELALCQGLRERCRHYQAEGIGRLGSQADEASHTELELLGILNDIYNDDQVGKARALLPLADSLVASSSFYFAALGLFHFIVNSDRSDAAEDLDRFNPVIEISRKSRAPFFKALTIMIDQVYSTHRDPGSVVRGLKATYRILEASGNRFAALVVCRRLAREYRDVASYKLARKFYDQSLKLARALQNESMAQKLLTEMEAVNQTGTDQSALVESVYGISEVLKNIKNYGKSLERAVQFAVDQTGAERGVILLKNEHMPGLQAAAVVNCDEDSLDDIADFSASIPLDVARQISPLIIDNAVTDKRTKNYKSIVAHNILSVICIPITLDDRVLGVLYLDHHTIPALFDRNDVIYVSSIANLLAVMVATVRSYRDMTLINRQLVEDVNKSGGRQTFVTEDVSLRELFGKLPEIARTNAPVLIVGESGTGKEILCEMIHNLSLRCGKPLIKLNCAAVAGTLIESELFGVAANVATDVKEREGKFAAADGGTLLLDEIGDMPLEVQAKVLRAVEYQQFEKVGSNKTMHTDIRFVYATNKDLAAMIKAGSFRHDLYYRINTVVIEIPPLRERRDDIILLTDYFLGLFSQAGKAPRLGGEAMEALVEYPWPGNVRELRNLVERCCILYPGQTIGVANLPPEIAAHRPPPGHGEEALERVEKEKIRKALAQHNWNQSRASAQLDIPLSTLRRKIKKYNISRLV